MKKAIIASLFTLFAFANPSAEEVVNIKKPISLSSTASVDIGYAVSSQSSVSDTEYFSMGYRIYYGDMFILSAELSSYMYVDSSLSTTVADRTDITIYYGNSIFDKLDIDIGFGGSVVSRTATNNPQELFLVSGRLYYKIFENQIGCRYGKMSAGVKYNLYGKDDNNTNHQKVIIGFRIEI